METFQLCFSVQGTGGSQTESDPDNRVADQGIGSPGRPVSLGYKCPVSRGIFIDSLALWKIINEELNVFIAKK
jgi:hypothetical protein